MAACLDYQVIPSRSGGDVKPISWRKQTLSIGLLLVAIGYRVHNRHLETQYGYDIHSEHKLSMELKAEKKDLEYQLSVLNRLENIRNRASETLSLGEITKSQILKSYR